MDVGLISTIVAGIFGALGVVVGFFLGKSIPKPHVEQITTSDSELIKMNNSIKELVNKVESLQTVILSAETVKPENIENQIKDIIQNLENVKNLANQKGIALTSITQIEESINTLKNLQNTKHESGYESLLISIKDNIMVVRNGIQSLKFDLEEQRKGATKIDVEKLKLAIKNAENINREAVKGDLISLIHAIKGEDGSELRATMDKIALESKELTLILKDLLQKSSGVKR